MTKSQIHSPLIYSYLKRYQEDPSSRVFAPLAEAYRKVGLVDEAIEIAQEGLKLHPHFIGGKVALARALFDKQQYSRVIDVLRPVLEDAPDNLVSLKLVAESYLMLSRVSEALAAYKMLLYFNPQDQETAQLVFELEAKAYEDGSLLLGKDLEEAAAGGFSIESASAAIDQDPAVQHQKWVSKVTILQDLLSKVERYRLTSRTELGSK